MEDRMSWSDFQEAAPGVLAEYGINIVSAALIFFVGQWIAKRVVFWVARVGQEHGLDATLIRFLANIVYVAVLVMLAIAAITRLGVPTTSFLAIIGAAGLAIGLALQGSLSNFASGVLLVFLKPCKVGDYIDTGSFSGTVEKVQMFNTVLSTVDNRTVVMPNTQLFNNPMVNYSTSGTRRVDMVVRISYNADVSKAQSLLRSIVEADTRVLKNPALQIGVIELADSSVNIALWPWVVSADYMAVKFDLNEKIKLALDGAGIDIPYPQMGVQVQQT